ncbi:MAG: hypothetical protein C4589_07340 [Peptococcaceae bacterium]|jgi:hypothetical protein|nr:MAG: hypothetical protein C4589_07340 [Peptococcaceae bacterium]
MSDFSKDRRSYFLFLSVTAGVIWFYVLVTTAVDRVDLSYMPMIKEMPPAFWAGFALLIPATAAWYFSPQTKAVHFLLLFQWTLYLFVAPELVQVNARGKDAIDHVVTGMLYLTEGNFAGFCYSSFPGFTFFLAFIKEIAGGITLPELERLASPLLHLGRSAGLGFMFLCLLKSRKQALFAVLLATALFWVQEQLDPCPQHMGIVLFLFFFGVYLKPEIHPVTRRLLLFVLYAGMVVVHPLSSFLALFIAVFLYLLNRFVKGPVAGGEIAGRYALVLVFGVFFTGWLLYSSDWVFVDAVKSLQFFMREPAIGFTVLKSYSAYHHHVVRLIYVFYSLVLVWLGVLLLRWEFWFPVKLERLFPLLCMSVSVYPVLSGLWNIGRAYLFAVPFLAWFLTRESFIKRRVNRLAFIFLVLLLPFNYIERYSAEYIYNVPAGEFSAAGFVCREIPPDRTVLIGRTSAPSPSSLAGTLYQPVILDGSSFLKPGRKFDFAADSSRNRNLILFYYGEDSLHSFKETIGRQKSSVVYSNGDYQLHRFWPNPGVALQYE